MAKKEETKKKPVERRDGKLIKEDEDEAMRMKAKPYAGEETEEEEEAESRTQKEAEDEDESCNKEAEDEDESGKKKKRYMKEDEDEDEDEDRVSKDQFGGRTPEEEAVDSTSQGHTTTTSSVIGTRQHVLVPSSNVASNRYSTAGSAQMGQSPSEVNYAGKSVNPDLLKSPLFVELSKQMSEFEKSFAKKMDATEKSFSTRLANIQKTLEAVEKFYKNMPLNKSVNDNSFKKSFSEKVSEGSIRYTD